MKWSECMHMASQPVVYPCPGDVTDKGRLVKQVFHELALDFCFLKSLLKINSALLPILVFLNIYVYIYIF